MTNAKDTLLEQGLAHLGEGLFEDAIDALSACLALDPRDVKALHGRAMARFKIKQWADAEADFAAATRLKEEDPELWSGLALSMAMQNKIYPAIAVFETLLERRPSYTQGRIELGLLNLKIGAIDRGRDHLEKALASRPTLAQRRLIESNLTEQKNLDKNRYYRPDFDRLRKTRNLQIPGAGLLHRILAYFKKETP